MYNSSGSHLKRDSVFMRVLELCICIVEKLDVWSQRSCNTKDGIELGKSTNIKLDLLKNICGWFIKVHFWGIEFNGFNLVSFCISISGFVRLIRDYQLSIQSVSQFYNQKYVMLSKSRQCRYQPGVYTGWEDCFQTSSFATQSNLNPGKNNSEDMEFTVIVLLCI